MRRAATAFVSRLRLPHAIALLFVANGLSMPALWPRFPQVKDAVGADEATFGLALLGTGLGGIVGSAVSPWVVRRIGARRAAVAFAVVLAAATVLVGFAGSVVALFGAFAVMGVSDGVADMTQNHLMFEVQRTTARSLTSRMHALWSVGALAGAAVGTASAARGVSVVAQSVVLAVVAWMLVGGSAWLLARRWADPVPPAAEAVVESRVAGPPVRRRWGGRWGMVVGAALAVAVVEGVANEWSALTLRDGLGASDGTAGAGPTAFAAAMLLGRLLGDRVIDRIGVAATSRAGGGLVVVGAGAGLVGAAALDAPWLLVAGLVLSGVGAAVLFPAMLAAGDRLDATGRGVAVAASASRAGFLAVPLVVGGLADVAGLPVAFGLLPLAGVAVLGVLPRALRGGGGARAATAHL